MHAEPPLLEAQRVEGEENLHEMAKETLKNLGISQAQMAGALATASALKSSLRSPQACSPCLAAKSTEPYHGPAKAKAVAGNTPFSLSWDQEDLFPGGGGGAVPHKPSFSTATASLKSIMLTLAPHERVGRKRGGDVIFRMIVQRLQGTKGLLIIDEAQHLLLPR